MNKLMSVMVLLGIVLVLTISSCQKQPTSPPNMSNIGGIITTGNTTTIINTTPIKPIVNTSTNISPAPTGDYKNVSYTLTGVEGDLVTLQPKAVSPDGAKITYAYSKPFNDNGLWQTRDGDTGKYLVKVTASDGILSTSADVLVIINPSNKAPIIDCPERINVKEGETVSLNCNFFDKENDPLVMEYSGWMSTPTLTTNFDTAGEHKVFIRASDGSHNVTKTIIVAVENVDRAPSFAVHLKDMTVTETDVITLKTNVTDPDGDTIKLTYSEPFNKQGIWKTSIGDVGTYPISVVASDGTLSTKETFTLTVKYLNTAPVLKNIPNITVEEGETVKISAEVKDREDDPVTVKYSGWMSTSSKTTTFDDAHPTGCNKRGCSAVYKVTVTASDGTFNVNQDVYVTVVDKNRPPVFVWGS